LARKYSKIAEESVETAMHKMKEGKLKSSRSGKTVKSKEQAVAIGLSEARKKGAKVALRFHQRRISLFFHQLTITYFKKKLFEVKIFFS
jgi:hypothetical protein